jgi:hypothetical protein
LTLNDSVSFVNCCAAPGAATISPPTIVTIPTTQDSPQLFFDTAIASLPPIFFLTEANTTPPTPDTAKPARD